MAGSGSQPLPSQPHLGIVHLLGWTLGVAVVLAGYRVGFQWLSDDAVPRLGWRELGFGLAYGTAISGLGLFVWRWWRGGAVLPTQPGHWLLVFGGLGLLVDFGSASALESLALLADWSPSDNRFYIYYVQQIFAWGVSAAVSLVVLTRIRASIWWRLLALVTALVFCIIAVASAVAFVFQMRLAFFTGSWAFNLPIYARLIGTVCCVIILAVALVTDHRRGLRRDWLHVGGIMAAVGLAALGIADTIRVLFP